MVKKKTTVEELLSRRPRSKCKSHHWLEKLPEDAQKFINGVKRGVMEGKTERSRQELGEEIKDLYPSISVEYKCIANYLDPRREFRGKR